MSRDKFEVRVELRRQQDVADGGSYTEVAVSITENGYQWFTQRFPAEKWPAVFAAVNRALEQP